MTKKHFVALAAALKEARLFDAAETARSIEADTQWERTIEGIAAVCADFSPRFDRARFLAACGVEEK